MLVCTLVFRHSCRLWTRNHFTLRETSAPPPVYPTCSISVPSKVSDPDGSGSIDFKEFEAAALGEMARSVGAGSRGVLSCAGSVPSAS